MGATQSGRWYGHQGGDGFEHLAYPSLRAAEETGSFVVASFTHTSGPWHAQFFVVAQNVKLPGASVN